MGDDLLVPGYKSSMLLRRMTGTSHLLSQTRASEGQQATVKDSQEQCGYDLLPSGAGARGAVVPSTEHLTKHLTKHLRISAVRVACPEMNGSVQTDRVDSSGRVLF